MGEQERSESQEDESDLGGVVYPRDDDGEDTVRERIKVYDAMTLPLLDYYQRLGLLAQVDGVGRPDEVEKRILASLDGIAAPSQDGAGGGSAQS